MLTIISQYGIRLYKLRVTEAEIKILIRSVYLGNKWGSITELVSKVSQFEHRVSIIIWKVEPVLLHFHSCFPIEFLNFKSSLVYSAGLLCTPTENDTVWFFCLFGGGGGFGKAANQTAAYMYTIFLLFMIIDPVPLRRAFQFECSSPATTECRLGLTCTRR